MVVATRVMGNDEKEDGLAAGVDETGAKTLFWRARKDCVVILLLGVQSTTPTTPLSHVRFEIYQTTVKTGG